MSHVVRPVWVHAGHFLSDSKLSMLLSVHSRFFVCLYICLFVLGGYWSDPNGHREGGWGPKARARLGPERARLPIPEGRLLFFCFCRPLRAPGHHSDGAGFYMAEFGLVPFAVEAP